MRRAPFLPVGIILGIIGHALNLQPNNERKTNSQSRLLWVQNEIDFKTEYPMHFLFHELTWLPEKVEVE